jgi:hypothetical protein
MADVTIGDLTPKGSDLELDDLLETSTTSKGILTRIDPGVAYITESVYQPMVYSPFAGYRVPLELEFSRNPLSRTISPAWRFDTPEEISIIGFDADSASGTTADPDLDDGKPDRNVQLRLVFEDDSTYVFTFKHLEVPYAYDSDFTSVSVVNNLYPSMFPVGTVTSTSGWNGASIQLTANVRDISEGRRVKEIHTYLTSPSTGPINVKAPGRMVWNLQIGMFSKAISGHDIIKSDGPYGRPIKTGDLLYSTDNLSSKGYVNADGTILLQSQAPDLYAQVGLIGGVSSAPTEVVSGTPTLPDDGYGCVFSSDGALLAVALDGPPGLTILNTSDWSIVSGTPTLAYIGSMPSFSPDGTLLAVTHSVSPYLTILNTSDWSIVSGTPTLSGYGGGCSFSPDGNYLAVGFNSSPYLTILNTSDWSVVSGTPTLAGIGRSIKFSPDGTLLAIAHGGSPYITILNTSDWSTVSGTPTLSGYGNGCAFSPDGTYLAIGFNSSPYLTILNTFDWSIVSGTPTLAGIGRKCSFSPDGNYLAIGHTGSPYLTILNTSDWSVVSGTPILPFTGYGCAFSPDGALLATAHYDSPYFTLISKSVSYSYNESTEFKLPNYDTTTFDEGVKAWLKK